MTNAPGLTADAPDDTLLATLHDWPNVVANLCSEVSRTNETIRTGPVGLAALGLVDYWPTIHRKIASLQPRNGFGAAGAHADAAKQLRMVLQARDMLAGVAADIPRLQTSDIMAVRGPSYAAGSTNDDKRQVMARFPGLANCLAWQDVSNAKLDAAQRAETERVVAANLAQQVADRKAAARALVKRLAGEGVTLTASPKGILARPIALLDGNAAAAVKTLRAELIELLDGPAELVA